MPTSLTEEQRAHILALAEKYGLDSVRVFGSYARGDATEQSDLDLLVTMGRPDLMELGGFQFDTQEYMGKKVDVVMEDWIHWYIKDSIIEEAKQLLP